MPRIKKSLFSILLVVVAAACGAPKPAGVSSVKQSSFNQDVWLFAAPPISEKLSKADMQSQTEGAFAVLRQMAVSNGISLADCMAIKVFQRIGEFGGVDQRGFSTAYSKFFGTKLLPNQPFLVQIHVAGFENPDQLILIEARCAKSGP
ncbi:MAG: hypothetical protein COA47_06575 [Robiginitomaculum sp.]|nr:MAG: hypothetical protein COA47_06575 [Robiginitomaculum sp.]